MRTSSRFVRSGIFACGLLALAATGAAQSGHPIFPAGIYRGGLLDEYAYPHILVGDVTGDGLPDAVLALTHVFTSGTLYVLRGNAQGGFGAPTPYGAGFGAGTPSSVAIGDVTGDGRDDVVLTTISIPTGAVVSVLASNAQGGLEPGGEYPGSGVVAVGDVDGDLRPDVVLGQPNRVCVMRSNAQGTLDSPVCYALPGNGFGSVALGDFDGDGRTDVVSASPNRVCVLRGNAQGTLDLVITKATGGSDATQLALGDVTGDGRLDVVLVNATYTMVCVLAGNAQGTLDSSACYASGVSQVVSIAVGDVSADGQADVVVAWSAPSAPDGGLVCMLKGNPNGTLDAPVAYVPGFVRPNSIALADLAGDGRLEVVLADYLANDACVLESDGQGGLEVAAGYDTGAAGPVAVGDVSGDGRLDVVQSRDSDDSICVLKGNAQGTLDPEVCYAAGGSPGPIATGEVSGDTLQDVVVSTSAGVCVLTGNAQGTLDPAVCYAGTSGELVVGDVSGDGRGDVVVSTNAGVCVLKGNAQGTLDAPVCTSAFQGYIALGDVTGDGRTDVVVADSTQPMGEVCVLAGNLLGTLDPPVCYPAGSSSGSVSGVAVGDVSGDGRADVVVTRVSGPGSGDTCVLLGNAQGTLDPAACQAPAGAPTGVRLGDVDDDGILDAVQGSFTTDSGGGTGGIYVGVLPGGVAGGLGSLRIYASGGANAGALVLGDVTGDGRLDAVVPGDFFASSGSGVSVLENRVPSLGTVTCTGGACPCGNAGTGERGCQNSAGTGGARLYGSGEPSLASDTARLFAVGEMPSALTIFLQGDAAIPATNFGDGLRCAGGALKRLFVKNASQGAISAPAVGEPSISARSASLGDVLAVGDLRVYQTYYRDPSTTFCPSPTGSTFNSSNALSVTWMQ